MGISSECWLIYKAIQPARELRAEYAWALQLILLIYVPGKLRVACGGCVESLLIDDRVVYSVYPHDEAEKEGHERQAGAKGRVGGMNNAVSA